MLDFLRTLRLGGLSVFGVMLPGLLLLGCSVIGLFVPITALLCSVSGGGAWVLLALAERHATALAVVALLIGYVLGYVLRLYSPDDLDRESVGPILRGMSDEEKKVWPCTGEPGDKFPYFHTHEYVRARSLEGVLKYVTWGRDVPKCEDESRQKRSKSVVNWLKLEIAIRDPELAAQVESHEAHIRLMAGAWRAALWSWPIIFAGLIAAVAGVVFSVHRTFGFSSDTVWIYAVLSWAAHFGHREHSDRSIVNTSIGDRERSEATPGVQASS